MTAELQPFRPQALEALAQVIGNHYTGSQIIELFRRGGSPDITTLVGTKWKFVLSTFDRLQQRAGGRPHAVLKVVETACNPQGWIGKRDEYEALLAEVNSVLEFYGLAAKDDGTLHPTGATASTVRPTSKPDEVAFDARSFHLQVVRHGRTHFGRGAYVHAVFECCKVLDKAVHANTGINETGEKLMGKALNPKGPMKLNRQLTQSEKDEQQGVMFLCMGLMSAVRNPQAHEPELHWPMSPEDALDVLGLISFLFRKFESAVVQQPSTGAFVPMEW